MKLKTSTRNLALGALMLTGVTSYAGLKGALDNVGNTAKSAMSSLSVQGQIYVNSTDLTASQKGFNFRESAVQLDAKLSEALSAQIVFELQELFVENLDLNDNIDLNELLRVVRIKYDPKDGPVAVIVGKDQQAFGLEEILRQMPAFMDSPLFEDRQIRKVKGITVALKDLKGFKAEMSIHDQSDRLDELDMDDFNSSTIRVSTTRGQYKFAVSHARTGEKLGDNFDDHSKSSAAALWTSKDGRTQVWVEALKLAEKDEIGVVGGASRKIGPATIVVEATKIEDLEQIGIGLMGNITDTVTAGIEGRYTKENDMYTDSVALAVRYTPGAGYAYQPEDRDSLLE